MTGLKRAHDEASHAHSNDGDPAEHSPLAPLPAQKPASPAQSAAASAASSFRNVSACNRSVPLPPLRRT